ncbi:class I SAM-dependent methyltransferase [Hydrocarboniclastica marina]|uniref:Class I SAM-dependent methyltransferase n=2 Tax=Hydrocarboniclastica marina TaxID=2259620 RepID=A0A4P7XHE8_9ALTE|nr:class I SAM-dependent methyltransferase [Hydrocarboniclastica marina]
MLVQLNRMWFARAISAVVADQVLFCSEPGRTRPIGGFLAMAAIKFEALCLKNQALCEQLDGWFGAPLGTALIESERRAVAKITSDLFGFRQLEVGISPSFKVGSVGNFGHRFSSVGTWSNELGDGEVVCAPEELALPNDCIDLVILHHTLDFTSHPHQALREASRVLRGGGHMLIIGFNPVSLWGWRRLVAKRPTGPWRGRFLSRGRIEDWLEVLDFVVEEKQFGFYRPPLHSPRLINRLAALDRFCDRHSVPGGAFYLMVAEKRVGARIRQRPAWIRKNVIAMPVANRSRPAHYPKEPSR